MVQTGDKAPQFALPDADGESVSLASFQGDKVVVLYFYPKDDTPGCTIEANDFTALQERFDAAGAVVLGVSRDDCASHAAFRDKYGLGVQLLSDIGGQVTERYGVWQQKEKNGVTQMGILRSTFIIDRAGTVRHALYGVAAQGHAQEVLEMVESPGQ